MSILVRSAKIIAREWDERPFRLIIILAIIFRLIAVVFSRGFGWFDDHFLIIEASQSWADNYDYNNWLPGSNGNQGPTGHNLFYTGLHFLFFKFTNYIGFTDPQGKMLVIRFCHAALSMMVVVLGYRMSLKLADLRTAKITGLLLAILWFFPFMSVRNLVEFTCVPFLLWGTWILIKNQDSKHQLLNGLFAGLVLGLAFSMRFQTLIYIGGIGLGLLILGRWKEAFATGAGILITAFLLLGTIDIYLWGTPFAELAEYINYNMLNAGEYNAGPWYQYLLVIFAILIPPVSFFLGFGFVYAFFRDWKKHLLIFLPAMIFLAFHSYFPNKQERFILPIIPFIIILGSVGWYQFLDRSEFWKKHKKLLVTCWSVFWIINIVVLFVISTTYSKRSRVESMSYLSRYEGIERILVENTNQYDINLLPMYYLGQWVNYIEVSKTIPLEKLSVWNIKDPGQSPDFFILEGDKNLDERVQKLEEQFPNMVYETSISPGKIDRILFWLNPINENQNAYIYRNAYLHPTKIE